jgi:hypothetical protein
MELNEFKELWKSLDDRDFNDDLTTEKTNLIIMKTTDTLRTINKTNEYWYIYTKIGTQILIGLFAFYFLLGIVLPIFTPITLPYFYRSTLYQMVIIAILYLCLYSYKIQKKIFTVPDKTNLAESLRAMVSNFNKYYLKMMILWTPLTAIMSYIGVSSISKSLSLNLSVGFTVIFTIVFTLVSIVGGHICYKLTYFRWIEALKQNIKDLES